ncbi:hypothetical protein OSB04_031016 [Centaurea solstitialis]|uniref:Uncharacterized protein n=1 Tax=Centaurea solstitialis TaxID=347529 RepID=A0AA38STX5_9ASTR|nr:hypothetical protein OSB04_031016 [Centaurea solstitialis]
MLVYFIEIASSLILRHAGLGHINYKKIIEMPKMYNVLGIRVFGSTPMDASIQKYPYFKYNPSLSPSPSPSPTPPQTLKKMQPPPPPTTTAGHLHRRLHHPPSATSTADRRPSPPATPASTLHLHRPPATAAPPSTCYSRHHPPPTTTTSFSSSRSALRRWVATGTTIDLRRGSFQIWVVPNLVVPPPPSTSSNCRNPPSPSISSQIPSEISSGPTVYWW